VQSSFTSQIAAAVNGEAQDFFKSKTAAKASTSKQFIKELLQTIIQQPETLGRMLGYRDLTRTHGKWIDACWNDRSRRETSFYGFRGSYKTTTRAVVGSIYNHLIRPDDTVLLCRKTDQGASETLGEIMQHYEGAVMRYIYKHAFGKAHPLRRANYNSFTLSTRKKITKESNMRSTGVAASITGGHYDVIFPDDIVTDRDRYYPTERERTINFARELRNIVNPGGIIRWNGTLWHKDDANHVVAPVPDIDSFWPVGSIKVKGFTLEHIEQLKLENPPSLYAANYALKMVEDSHPGFGAAIQGNLTDEQWKQVKIVATIDPAYDGEDCTALCIGGKFEGKFYVRFGGVWRKNIADMYGDLIEQCNGMGVSHLIVETNGDKGLSYRSFRNDSRCRFTVGPKNNQANKYQRITTTLKRYWQHIRFGVFVTPEFMGHVCEYSEHAKHDDGADALEMLVNYFDPSSRVQTGKIRNF